MKRIALPCLLALAACQDSGYPSERYEAGAPEPVAMMAEADMAAPAPRMAKSSAPADSGENPVAQSYLAYRYSYQFALPFAAVRPTMDAHMQRCLSAGPNRCQVLGSNVNAWSEDQVNATLRFRAEPEWLESFVADAKSGVTDAGGQLTSSDMSAEDLTRQILDTDARLKAQTTLRDRLQGLLETRNAELPDLLALERELARVQGEIESATTTLAVLRKRVSMSETTFSYQTKTSAVSSSAFAPLGRALKNFVGNVAGGLAAVIDFVAVILPWLLFVILPGLWMLRWFWRRRKAA